MRKRNALKIWILGLALVTATGCGEEVFRLGESTNRQEGPGSFVIPAKVDILLVEDDSGSRFEAHEALKDQMPEFLAGIETFGWDFHFAAVPLTHLRSSSPFNQIGVSAYDGNFSTSDSWKAPFPGAEPFAPGMAVSSSFFRSTDDFSEFISESDLSNDDNAWEPGFETMLNVLEHPVSASSGFLRDDALLVVFVVGNGQDTTGAEPCYAEDGRPKFCGADSVASLAADFTAIKGSSELIRFYAAVSYTTTWSSGTECLGSAARVGTRYISMAGQLRGESYDVCTQPVSSILSALDSQLRAVKMNFRTRYLIIGHEPDVSTIRVLRYENGDPAQSTVIPPGEENGWTYEGRKTVFTIDYPIPMNRQTGHVIELHGSARITGTDAAEVFFTPKR